VAFTLSFHSYAPHHHLHSFPHDALPISTRTPSRPCAASDASPHGCGATRSSSNSSSGCEGTTNARAETQAFTGSTCTACIRRSRSEEHTSELQSRFDLVCRLLLEKKKDK